MSNPKDGTKMLTAGLSDIYHNFVIQRATQGDAAGPAAATTNTMNSIKEGSENANRFLEESSIEYKPAPTLDCVEVSQVAPIEQMQIGE